MTRPLRHRATPVDAVDAVTHLADDEVAGVKHIRADDPYLEGHYPGLTTYPGVCIPPSPPDLDCGQIAERNFAVVGSDPHRFDGDNDGIGCES